MWQPTMPPSDISIHTSSLGVRNRRTTTNSTQPPRSPLSNLCNCGECPKVLPDQLYRRAAAEGTRRLDDPFLGLSQRDIREIACRIACQYHLKRLQNLFERVALLIHDPSWFDAPQESSASIASAQSLSEDENGHVQQSISHDADVLTEAEIFALRNEPKLGFWDQTWPFRSTCYMLFIAAIVQGWIETSTNSAQICFIDSLINTNATAMSLASRGSISSDRGRCNDSQYYEAIRGAINAAPFLFGTVGCWTVDWLNEKLMGRRRAIIVSTLLIFASAIASAFMNSWWSLLLCRVFLGMGMGGKAAVVPVFLAEIAPRHIRGTTIMNWQVFDALGIALGDTANLLASRAEPANVWRWGIVSTAIPAFALLVGLTLVSWDSPRFEMKHEKEMHQRYFKKRHHWETAHPDFANEASDITPPWFGKRLYYAIWYGYGPYAGYEYRSKAFETLVILRGNEILAAKELVFTHCQLIIQQLSLLDTAAEADDIDFSIQTLSYRRRLCDFFDSKSYLSRELTAAIIVMVAQQTCGVNFLIFYSTQLFDAVDSSSKFVSTAPIWISWSIGVSNFLFAIPAYYLIQSRGRRWLLLTTMPLLSILLALAAGSFQAPSKPEEVTVTIWTLLYMFIYSPGLGPVPFTLSAELFPVEYRMVGMSLVVSINFLVGGLFIFASSLVPPSKESILFGCFAAANILLWIFVYGFVREPERESSSDTRITTGGSKSGSFQATLEEIYRIYSPPHSDFFTFLHLHKWDFFRIITLPFRPEGSYKEPLVEERCFLDWLAEREHSAEQEMG